jgi:hypothetical protein
MMKLTKVGLREGLEMDWPVTIDLITNNIREIDEKFSSSLHQKIGLNIFLLSR